MPTPPFPPGSPAVQLTVAAYLYWQYNDDVYLQAFIDAYNTMSQGYADCLNGLSLPVYTNGNIAGALLDWVAQGIYGISRPVLPSPGIGAQGPYASYQYTEQAYAGYTAAQGGGYFATTDDFFKRVITWAFYKGDGKVCSILWLKRRISRFLTGVNGVGFNIDQTSAISVTFTAAYQGLIKVPASSAATIFIDAVNAGVLELPFQWTWTAQTWTPPAGAYLAEPSSTGS